MRLIDLLPQIKGEFEINVAEDYIYINVRHDNPIIIEAGDCRPLSETKVLFDLCNIQIYPKESSKYNGDVYSMTFENVTYKYIYKVIFKNGESYTTGDLKAFEDYKPCIKKIYRKRVKYVNGYPA